MAQSGGEIVPTLRKEYYSSAYNWTIKTFDIDKCYNVKEPHTATIGEHGTMKLLTGETLRFFLSVH